MSDVHNLLLRDLAVVMIVAGVVTLLFHRLKQPVVLGYILAGVIVGPHLLPWPLVADEESVHTLSEFGIVFLLFSLGMDFSLRTLKRVGATAVLGAIVEIVGMLFVGYEIGRLFGWGRMDCLFLGAILSISSTTITIKVLNELGKTKARFAELSFGILVVEDILAIALIALLSGLAITGSFVASKVAVTLGSIAIFLIAVFIIGLIAVPRLLDYVARYRSDEMLLVTVLGLCFGVSLLAVRLGYSVALGAFLIGSVVGESRQLGRIKALTAPVRDMFSAVFFVAIGMLISPTLVARYAWPIAVVTIAVIVGKVLTRIVGVFLAGNDTRTSLRVAMTLAQIGEFSFIIAALGESLKQPTGEFLYPIAVSVSVITTLLTPVLIKKSDPLVAWFDRVAPASFVNYCELYCHWLETLWQSKKHNEARRLLRKWSWQIALNVALLTGVFMVAAYGARRAAQWWPNAPAWLGGAQSALWLGAAVLALPLGIAAVRKLQALGMLASELSITTAGPGRNMTAMRSLMSNTIFYAGTAGLGIWILLVSSAVLPSWPAMLVLGTIVAVIAAIFWRFFIQIHAKAQVALMETLAGNAALPARRLDEPLPVLLKQAKLETIELPNNSAAVKKLIRELEVRRKTGASIVGIERATGSIINPGADEELHAGDNLLLLGTDQQLSDAHKLLGAGE